MLHICHVTSIPMFGSFKSNADGQADKGEQPGGQKRAEENVEIVQQEKGGAPVDVDRVELHNEVEMDGGGNVRGDGKPRRHFDGSHADHIMQMESIAFPDERSLEEEAENFRLFDTNGDTFVDRHEWLKRLDPDEYGKSATGSLRWKEEFRNADQDTDGKLSWEEWVAMLFHEDPQSPKFVDGHHPDGVSESTEDIMLSAFDKEDANNDGELTREELVLVLMHADRRHRRASQVESGEVPEGAEEESDEISAELLEDIEQMAVQVMQDLDADGSGTISAEEWLVMGRTA